jgi:hypothetical protein
VLRGNGAAARAVGGALAADTADARPVAAAEAEALAVRGEVTTSRSAAAAAEVALGACQGAESAGAGSPASMSPPSCGAERAAVTTATVAVGMFDRARALFAPAALGSIADGLETGARTVATALPGSPGKTLRAAGDELVESARLVRGGVAAFVRFASAADPGAALAGARSALHTCLSG